jgi:hypothetical protein
VRRGTRESKTQSVGKQPRVRARATKNCSRGRRAAKNLDKRQIVGREREREAAVAGARDSLKDLMRRTRKGNKQKW